MAEHMSSAQGASAMLYTSLNPQKKEIRLLYILPATAQAGRRPFDTRVRCRLETVSMLDDPSYECISYHWGDPDNTEEILVNGIAKQATIGLVTALRRFRLDEEEDQDTRLWVDALCINQSNDEERSAQVKIMAEIYTAAARVRVWVDWPYGSAFNEDEQSRTRLDDLNLGIIMMLSCLNETNIVPVTQRFADAIHELYTLFERPYWNRVWIIQEVALARLTTLYYGRLKLKSQNRRFFGDFAPGLAAIQKMLWDLMKHVDANDGPPLTSIQRALPRDLWSMTRAHRALNAASQLRVAVDWMTLPERRTLPQVVSLRGRECSDKHDYVYGILGLLPRALDITPDYSQSLPEVLADFTFKAIRSFGSMSILPDAMSQRPGLPSWVVDLTPEGQNTIIPRPMVILQSYDAAKGSTFAAEMDQGALQVPAAHLARVGVMLLDEHYKSKFTSTGELSANVAAIELLTYMRMEAFSVLSEETITDALEMIRDAAVDKYVAEKGISEALLRTVTLDLQHFEPTSDLSEMRGLRLPASVAVEYKAVIDAWVRKVLSGTPQERDCPQALGDCNATTHIHKMLSHGVVFFTEDGTPGMASDEVKLGDVVSIIATCPVPLVLRYEERNALPCYRLVSRCYLDGAMDGEALEHALETMRAEGFENADIDDLFEPIRLV